VKMRGIKVGVVDGYRFAEGDDEAVSVTARIDEGVPVHTGAEAYIKRNLVTGIASVEIDNGPSDSPLLITALRAKATRSSPRAVRHRQGRHRGVEVGGKRRAGCGAHEHPAVR